MINARRDITSFGTLPYLSLDQLLNLFGNVFADSEEPNPNHFWFPSFHHFETRMKEDRQFLRRESMSLHSAEDLLYTIKSLSSYPTGSLSSLLFGAIVTSDQLLLNQKHLTQLWLAISIDPMYVRLLSLGQVMWMLQQPRSQYAREWNLWLNTGWSPRINGQSWLECHESIVCFSSSSGKSMRPIGRIPIALRTLLSNMIQESLKQIIETCSKSSARSECESRKSKSHLQEQK